MRLRSVVIWAGLIVFVSFSGSVFAQPYPNKPIRMYVGYAAGGGTDVIARLFAKSLAESWGQPVVVDNRSGADGTISNELTARASNDGYTINMITSAFTIAANNLKVRFDPIKDFSPITLVATNPNLLVVNAGLPVTTTKGLIALAKSKPGQLTSGSGGEGGPFLAMELFKSMAGIEIVNVTYKGNAEAVIDIIAGRTQLMFGSISTTLPHVESGKLKALAISTSKRSSRVPDLPTVAEAGELSGFDYATWYGILAPARTPAAVVQRLNSGIVAALDTPEIRGILGKSGFDPIGNTPAEFSEVIRLDLAKWKQVLSRIPKQ